MAGGVAGRWLLVVVVVFVVVVVVVALHVLSHKPKLAF